MSDSQIEALRDRIDAGDRAIVEAVNTRLELVAELKGRKGELGLAFVDPDRERRLVDQLAATSRGPLSEDGVRELAAAVLELTKRELERRASARG
jgi:3-deoxy-7-phosphoheptulonate synthase/chorismate mutase